MVDSCTLTWVRSGLARWRGKEDTTTSQSRPGRAPAAGTVPAGCAGCRGFSLFCAPIADGPVDCDGWAACEIILPAPRPRQHAGPQAGLQGSWR